ncbi:MAG: SpoVG family protein [Candidatus Pacebacteria bacterium]|nr:SpoVG family protein [Candidatus Paceibacterota bacterium]
MIINEVEITPVKPNNGLIAFASCVIDEWLYLGSIGIYTKLEGGYRLTFPTKKLANTSINIYHPINRDKSQELEQVIINKYEKVMSNNNDRYHSVSD